MFPGILKITEQIFKNYFPRKPLSSKEIRKNPNFYIDILSKGREFALYIVRGIGFNRDIKLKLIGLYDEKTNFNNCFNPGAFFSNTG